MTFHFFPSNKLNKTLGIVIAINIGGSVDTHEKKADSVIRSRHISGRKELKIENLIVYRLPRKGYQ
jgi:hypothetical protein